MGASKIEGPARAASVYGLAAGFFLQVGTEKEELSWQ